MKKNLVRIIGACLFSTAVMLFTVACGTQPEKGASHTHGKRFQSVDPSEAVLLEKGEYNKSCSICGMHLPTFYKTNHAIIFKDGKALQFCSIHCLVETMEYRLSREEKAQIGEIKAVDALTNAMIDVKGAYYVIGSKKPGTMSMVSKYVFKEKADAEGFVRDFGGGIADYEGAYSKAKEDFASRKMMHYAH